MVRPSIDKTNGKTIKKGKPIRSTKDGSNMDLKPSAHNLNGLTGDTAGTSKEGSFLSYGNSRPDLNFRFGLVASQSVHVINCTTHIIDVFDC
jgi:hypothetical protein